MECSGRAPRASRGFSFGLGVKRGETVLLIHVLIPLLTLLNLGLTRSRALWRRWSEGRGHLVPPSLRLRAPTCGRPLAAFDESDRFSLCCGWATIFLKECDWSRHIIIILVTDINRRRHCVSDVLPVPGPCGNVSFVGRRNRRDISRPIMLRDRRNGRHVASLNWPWRGAVISVRRPRGYRLVGRDHVGGRKVQRKLHGCLNDGGLWADDNVRVRGHLETDHDRSSTR